MKKFVYSLSHNGQVFYIGCTKDIHKRYKQHIKHTWQPTANAKYIADLLQQGIFPEINIIDYLPECEAMVKEIVLIKMFNKAGQKLTNYQNTYGWHTKPNVTETKSMKAAFRIVKYHQEVYLFHFHNKDENGKQITYQYPITPII